jgi:phospholipid/cholesterol/gamma-HCH transport system substrate-binding protein
MSKSMASAPGRVSRGRIGAVVLVAVVGATAATSGLAAHGPDTELTIAAEFSDASPLIAGNEVKVDGVKVGEVSGISVEDGKRALVALTLDRAALPVHSDARTTIRPVSLLGERYLELDRGSPSAPQLRNGDVLPVEQNGQTTDLDQVLNTIDEPTGKSLAALVTMLGEGMRGNGANTDATIRALASSMADTDGLVKILNDQNALLNDVVDRVGPVATALAADNGKTLDGLVNSARRLTATAANNQQALEDTLSQLPDTLSAARTTLAQLNGTAQATTPTLAAIRPTTDDLSAISEELKRFADSADPALASAEPVLRRADELLNAAKPVTEELRKSGPNLQSTATSLSPLVTDLTGNLGNVLNFIRNWALATNGHDGLSHYLRVLLTVNADTVTGLLPGAKGSADNPGQHNNAPPAATPLLPLPLPLPSVGNLTGPLLGGLLPPANSPDGSATGLTPQQESGVLGFLIGGGH